MEEEDNSTLLYCIFCLLYVLKWNGKEFKAKQPLFYQNDLVKD